MRSTASPATRTLAQSAFKEKLGVGSEQLSDFEPKGAACAAFGVLHPGGFPQRALVITGPDGVVRWSYQAASPGELPGVELLREGLAAAGSAVWPASASAKLRPFGKEKKETDRRPTGGTGRQ